MGFEHGQSRAVENISECAAIAEGNDDLDTFVCDCLNLIAIPDRNTCDMF